MIIVALISPLLGAADDQYSNKKKFLFGFTILCVAATGLLYTVTEGMVVWGMALFILSNIGFQAGLGFYDAFLKEITAEENYNRVSSLGYGVGYAGSLFSLASVIVFKDQPRLTFIACAFIFLVFSMPFFIMIREKKDHQGIPGISILRAGFERVKDTLAHLSKYGNIRTFLISYFIYIDGVNTIIFFSAIYSQSTLGFSIPELILFFMIVQATALIGSFGFGYIAISLPLKGHLY